jgi:hypothetical protein
MRVMVFVPGNKDSEAGKMPDRELMTLLELAGPAPFRMDREYLASLRGYVVERYWLLERRGS